MDGAKYTHNGHIESWTFLFHVYLSGRLQANLPKSFAANSYMSLDILFL